MSNVSLPSSTNSSDPESEKCHYLYDGSLWRQSYLTDFTRANLVAVTITNSVAVLPTILLNALVILAVVSRCRLRTNSNKLVAWLAGTDFISGLVVQPIGIAVELKRILSDGPFCTSEKASWVVSLGSGFITLGNLALISIDRYVSIKHPLRYRTIITKKRVQTGLLLVWAIGLLVTIQEITLAVKDSGTELYLLYIKVKDVILAIVGSIGIAVIIYTYCYIFSETRRQNKRVQAEQLSQEEAKRVKKEKKAANTLTMILGSLVLTYIPVIIVTASSDDIIEPHVMSVLWSWVATFNYLASLSNPIIFFLRMKKLRHAVLEILHYRQPENSPPPIEMKVIKRYRLEIQPTSSEAFSMVVTRQDPVLLSFSRLQAEEIVHIE